MTYAYFHTVRDVPHLYYTQKQEKINRNQAKFKLKEEKPGQTEAKTERFQKQHHHYKPEVI